MSADIGAPLKVLKVDGGAAANDLLMQLQADLLGVSIARPTMLEATALGAVFLAGLGAGVWSDTAALAGAWQQDRAFTPSAPSSELDALRRAWERAVALA